MSKKTSSPDPIKELIAISKFYGVDKEAVIAGGGNTSYKNDEFIWVKSSGIRLADLGEDGLVQLYRHKLRDISTSQFSENPDERELQVKKALYAACFDPETARRPSVETNLHEILNYSFVVHLHPTYVNALLCGKNSASLTQKLFGERALYIPYTDPGYILFKTVLKEVNQFREKFGKDPVYVFLENHGVFMSANSTEEIRQLYSDMMKQIKAMIKEKVNFSPLPIKLEITKVLPGIRMMLSRHGLKTLRIRHNKLIKHFYKDKKHFQQISRPFSPDIIVYCKAHYIYIDETGNPEKILANAEKQINEFEKKQGFLPKIILIKNLGLIAADENAYSAETALDIYEDLMKISYLSNWFGGPRFMTDDQIHFIENWELENYRRKIASGSSANGKVAGKTAVVTGGAMGFGAGIAENLFAEGANIMIADIDPNEAEKVVFDLRKKGGKNQVFYTRVDVSEESDMIELIRKTVELFGAIDLFVNNAGILRAGSLEKMDMETFDRMTRVNYNAYFLATKLVSGIMKLQNQYAEDKFFDIIQINSKSGLKGSNKNFAYAGGKFGGIGLTQSFALELMPFRIKVNSICPGNFFDGPLWSDPKKGLFVQYLKNGKVPGAKSVADVKKHYEKQVPAGRGCEVSDVMKALYYAVDQKYETGQAIPVTGGQIMLH